MTFANSSAFLIYPTLLKDRDYSYLQVGIIVGAFSFSNALLRIPLSKFVRIVAEYSAAKLGLIIICVSCFAYIFTENSFRELVINRIVHGAGFSLLIIAFFTYIAKEIPEEKRYLFFINVGIVMMGSAALIPILTEILINKFQDQVLYLTSLWYGVLCFFFLTPLKTNKKPKNENSNALPSRYSPPISFILLLFSTWTFSHSQASILNFVGLLIHKMGMGRGGSYIGISLLTAMIASIVLYKLGRMPHLGIGYLLMAGGAYILCIEDPPIYLLLLSALLSGIAMAVGFALLNQYASTFGDREQKATTMAIFTFTYDLGFITGTFLSGFVSEYYDLKGLFGVVGTVSLLGLWGSMAFLSKRKEGLT